MPSAATYPFLPLAVDIHLANISGLTDAQAGIYFKLILHLWRVPGHRLPNDDAWLGMRLGMTPDRVAAEVRPLVAILFECDGNWITHSEVDRQTKFIRKQSRAQSDRAKSRWEKEKRVCPDDATVGTPGQCRIDAPTPTPTPTPTKKEDIGVGNPPPAPDKYAWSGWVIRLTRRQYDEWKQAYFAITDFSAELRAADDYYTEHPPKDGKWFFAVSNWLKRAHAEALTKPPGSPNGSGGVPWTNVGKGSNWR